eukprot:TRINITY_DN6393_c0_g1_i2.p1 TRINITY_DN6393_c0_g1~~TRINITY_DN6393_c0_g1_i2.p1  ORF type:complete len:448 (+),score=150.14 TRINITY_DN6393_c0_g1_i2:197-1540(+)
MRVMPKRNPAVNEEWLNDKSRFATDGLTRQRLDTPLMRKGGSLVRVSWEEALSTLAGKMAAQEPGSMAGVVGDLVDCESMTALKDLLNAHGHEDVAMQGSAALSGDIRAGYVLNSTLEGAEQADAVLLLGTNPRHEGTLFNTRLRKIVLHKDVEVAVVGPPSDLTYGTTHLGNSTATLASLAKGNNEFNAVLASASRPMVVVGMAGLSREDSTAVKAAVAQLAAQIPNLVTDEWNGLNVLHTAAAAVGALELGLQSKPEGLGHKRLVYLLGADEVRREDLHAQAYVVYQGHHGDAGAAMADIVLPGAAYTEKQGTYVNTEGRVQRTKKVVQAPGDAREDWAVLRALSEVAGTTLPYSSLPEVHARMAEISPSLAHVDELTQCNLASLALQQAAEQGQGLSMEPSPFKRHVSEFYASNPIARASVTMGQCIAKKMPGNAFTGNGVVHE